MFTRCHLLIAVLLCLAIVSTACGSSSSTSSGPSVVLTSPATSSGSKGASPSIGSASTAPLGTGSTTSLSATEPAAAAPSTSNNASPVTLPSTAAGTALRWVLDSGRTATDEEFTARFSPTFIGQVPAAQLRQILEQLGALTPIEITASTDTTLVATVQASNGTPLVARIAVEELGDHRILGLLFRPKAAPPPTTWEAVDQRLGALAPQSALYVAELKPDGEMTAIHSQRGDDPGPIGSEFKLYVLGALVDAIGKGEIAWTDNLTIRDELKSIPSGELQDRSSGTTVTVREAAQKMIEISDNTAADLLMNRLGRDHVEAVLATMGMSAASQQRTLPFLTTREFSIIKYGDDAGLAERYAKATTEQRRELLAKLSPTLPSLAKVTTAGPIAVDSVEWFASPHEIANAHAWLDRRADVDGTGTLAPLREILGKNPGVELDAARWKRWAFKGGSEPGVGALSWLLQRNDDRRFVIAGQGANRQQDVDVGDAVSIATGVINLTGQAR